MMKTAYNTHGGDDMDLGRIIHESTQERILSNMEMRIKEEQRAGEERLSAKIDDVEERLNDKIDNTEERLSARIDDVEERLKASEERLNSKIDDVEGRLNIKIDDAEERLSATCQRIEKKLDDAVVELKEEQRASEERLKEEQRASEERLKEDISKIYDFKKWIVGMLITVVVGFIGVLTAMFVM